MRRFLLVVPLALSTLRAAPAAELRVPSPYPTVQAAINAAVDGDVVLVAPGEYVENLDVPPKKILIASTDGPLVTVLRALNDKSVVRFQSGVTPSTVLQGFTIRDGKGTCFSVPGSGNYSYGGGIFCRNGAGPTLTGNIITANTTTSVCSTARRRGGGIALERDSVAVIVGNMISDNVVEGGGNEWVGAGIYVGENCYPMIRGNVITNNLTVGGDESHPTRGGGIYCYRSSPTIEENTVTGNVADVGGGIGMADMLGGEIRRNAIFGNSAIDGGGIFAYHAPVSGSDVLVLQNEIRNNEASDYGGGADLYQTRMTLRQNLFEGNSAPNGGGISVRTAAEAGVQLRRNRILRNQATVAGGGIYLHTGNCFVINNLVAGNDAGDVGGGIHVENVTAFPVIPDLTNNTVARNHASSAGGGLFHNDAAGEVAATNTIFWGNTAGTGPAVGGSAETVMLRFCDVEGGFPGEGNLDADPMFLDPERDDFRLRPGSPCVDAGTNDSLEAASVDLEGDDRPLDGDLDASAVVDIGADELRPERVALWGTVNAGGGRITDVLYANGETGGDDRTVSASASGPVWFEILLPPAGGSGRYVIHANLGAPSPGTVTPLPAGAGWCSFPMLIPAGATPVAVWNNAGREDRVGWSRYFDGTPLPPPPRAPAVFLYRAAGDPANLPPGTVLTLQGATLDPGSAATKNVSVTNGVVIEFL